jgi:hypothetical protein
MITGCIFHLPAMSMYFGILSSNELILQIYKSVFLDFLQICAFLQKVCEQKVQK